MKPNRIFGWRRIKRDNIWKTVFILPRVLTLIDIVTFISARRCLMAITRNSREMIIRAGIRNNIESKDLDNNKIVTTTSNLSAIGSKKAPNGVSWLNFLATNPSK